MFRDFHVPIFCAKFIDIEVIRDTVMNADMVWLA